MAELDEPGRCLRTPEPDLTRAYEAITDTEREEWRLYVDSVKALLQAGVRSGDGWKVNGSWVDVKGGRAFFIGDMLLPVITKAPVTSPVREQIDIPAPPATPSILDNKPPAAQLAQKAGQASQGKIDLESVLGILFGILIVGFVLGAWVDSAMKPKSCEQLEQEAWEECNDDYNGKCRYLGPKYQVRCYPDEDDEAMDEWERSGRPDY